MYFAGVTVPDPSPQQPCTVLVKGLPRGVCTAAHAEIMLDEAGIKGTIISCTVADGASYGEMGVSLTVWSEVTKCITHFNGCCWNGSRVSAFIAVPLATNGGWCEQVPNVTHCPSSATENPIVCEPSRSRTYSDSQYGSEVGSHTCFADEPYPANIDEDTTGLNSTGCDGSSEPLSCANADEPLSSEPLSCANIHEERNVQEAQSERHADANIEADHDTVDDDRSMPDIHVAPETNICDASASMHMLSNATSQAAVVDECLDALNPNLPSSQPTARLDVGGDSFEMQIDSLAGMHIAPDRNDDAMITDVPTSRPTTELDVGGDDFEMKIGSLAISDGILCSDRVLSEALLSMFTLAKSEAEWVARAWKHNHDSPFAFESNAGDKHSSCNDVEGSPPRVERKQKRKKKRLREKATLGEVRHG